MMLPGSQHKERYELMKSEVETRQVDWWFYRSNTQMSNDMLQVIDILKNEFEIIGPFGSYFVKENRSNFKPDFYQVPLQHCFVIDHFHDFEGMAFTASNGKKAILLKTIYDFFRNPVNEAAFREIMLSAICVQTATNAHGKRMAISVECIEGLRPMSFYEHPPIGRLFLAMENQAVLERSVLSMCGDRRTSSKHLQEILTATTNLYNDFEMGNVEKVEMSNKLYSFFENKK